MKRSLPVIVVLMLATYVAPPRASAQARGEASRVRILLACDMSGDEVERRRRVINRDQVESALEEGLRRQGLGQRYSLDILAGPRLSRSSVLAYYRNLRTGPTEALLFYSNAHGNTDPKLGHFLVLGGQRLYRSELRAAMGRGRPRLIIILTDSCANVPGKPAPNDKPADAGARPAPAPKQAVAAGNGTVLRHLLFRHQGVVDVNGARRGHVAWGNTAQGNCFTSAFINLLKQPAARFDPAGTGVASWAEFYRALYRETATVARARGLTQTPQAFSLARKVGAPGVPSARSKQASVRAKAD